MEAVVKLAQHVRQEMSKVVVGQEEMKTQCLVSLLCNGHALLEGVPGIAKTLTIKTLSRILGLDFQRVQCTSDLMPADIIGTKILNMATGAFQLHQGPVFTSLLLVDEVNRMPPRTQAALLECMQERQVTIDGERLPLSADFAVFATQNPIDFEGTYPLPEAQLDRFLVKVRVPYPEADEEVQLLVNLHNGFDSERLDDVEIVTIEREWLAQARQAVRAVKMQESLFAYIAELTRRTRDWPALSLGSSPRAAVNLLMFSKALAALDGRDYLIPDDVKQAAPPVFRHRIMVKPEADLEGCAPWSCPSEGMVGHDSGARRGHTPAIDKARIFLWPQLVSSRPGGAGVAGAGVGRRPLRIRDGGVGPFAAAGVVGRPSDASPARPPHRAATLDHSSRTVG